MSRYTNYRNNQHDLIVSIDEKSDEVVIYQPDCDEPWAVYRDGEWSH